MTDGNNSVENSIEIPEGDKDKLVSQVLYENRVLRSYVVEFLKGFRLEEDPFLDTVGCPHCKTHISDNGQDESEFPHMADCVVLKARNFFKLRGI